MHRKKRHSQGQLVEPGNEMSGEKNEKNAWQYWGRNTDNATRMIRMTVHMEPHTKSECAYILRSPTVLVLIKSDKFEKHGEC